MLSSIESRIADELHVRPAQVAAAVALLDEGATVPFIARYRKEATGTLDDVQLRTLAERLVYLRELEERRAAILASIAEQGKLDDALRVQVEAAETKQRLEDLYLPYKPKRRTRAQIAREAGLAPLAEGLLADPTLVPETEAARFVRTGQEPAERNVPDVKAALDGARQILIERFAEDATLLAKLRREVSEHAELVSTMVEGKENEGAKFRDWFAYRESLATVPSHRALAMLRGRNEGVLRLELKTAQELEDPPRPSPCIGIIAQHAGIADRGRAADKWLADTARWTWTVKLSLHLEVELMAQLRTRAEDEAIRVFARNLHDLLLAAPAGPRVTLGLDPGLRTGVKLAVVDRTGKLVDTATIHPHEPRRDWEGAITTLRALSAKHAVELVAIGNGTASRETDKLAADLMKRHPELKLSRVTVSEAGASVYSASEVASQELPDVDVSLRGAASIARRLQDPLAELVKIDPKSIGVGQYQHDVDQGKLGRTLDAVVEDCVNDVGVDVNTASPALLAHVSGLNASLAAGIVSHRDAHGAFRSRKALLEVPRLGAKTFEQAAGFLRIRDGDTPLDASGVHPESYPVVERILADLKKDVREIVGDTQLLRTLKPETYARDGVGVPTVVDILKELEKPGRDPRPAFRTAAFAEGVEEMKDLQPGMRLEGTVTNVTNFGAFVDIGVHQDGLVHISALSHKFVKDPHAVVKAGDVVMVKVMEVDVARKRIALTMRMDDDPGASGKRESRDARGTSHDAGSGRHAPRQGGKPPARREEPKPASAMAAAFAKLRS